MLAALARTTCAHCGARFPLRMVMVEGRAERYTDEIGPPPLNLEAAGIIAIGVAYPGEEFWFASGDVVSPEDAHRRLVAMLKARSGVRLGAPRVVTHHIHLSADRPPEAL